MKNKKVLITCGPTWIAIDDTRVISNKSSGLLGQLIALECLKAKARVTLLEGPVTTCLDLPKTVKVIKYNFFDELFAAMKRELKKNYDVCIHVAAVSDYKVRNPKKTKLDSHRRHLTLNLTPTPKIIHSIKQLNSKILLVGFKLESSMSRLKALKSSKDLIDNAGCDYVVANTMEKKGYKAYILNKNKQLLSYKTTRPSLAKSLVQILNRNQN